MSNRLSLSALALTALTACGPARMGVEDPEFDKVFERVGPNQLAKNGPKGYLYCADLPEFAGNSHFYNKAAAMDATLKVIEDVCGDLSRHLRCGLVECMDEKGNRSSLADVRKTYGALDDNHAQMCFEFRRPVVECDSGDAIPDKTPDEADADFKKKSDEIRRKWDADRCKSRAEWDSDKCRSDAAWHGSSPEACLSRVRKEFDRCMDAANNQ